METVHERGLQLLGYKTDPGDYRIIGVKSRAGERAQPSKVRLTTKTTRVTNNTDWHPGLGLSIAQNLLSRVYLCLIGGFLILFGKILFCFLQHWERYLGQPACEASSLPLS